MFGATILVPLLTGLSPSTALFTAGTGTLIYILCTGAKVPAFLGSSFAFIPALTGISQQYGIEYALGGALCAGIFYAIVAGIVKIAGTKWLDKALPPVVIGSVIIVILGLIDGMKNFNPLYIASCLTFSSISWAHSKRLKKY